MTFRRTGYNGTLFTEGVLYHYMYYKESESFEILKPFC